MENIEYIDLNQDNSIHLFIEEFQECRHEMSEVQREILAQLCFIAVLNNRNISKLLLELSRRSPEDYYLNLRELINFCFCEKHKIPPRKILFLPEEKELLILSLQLIKLRASFYIFCFVF
ncbi:hypothetical protein [Pedobacter sp.]|uniref:hypothetical protein n=1 Tax=Pedobacter sp. TaxID=1411316 RepID=UPI003D7F1E3F